MNHREPTSVPRGTGQALPCLALLLLPLLAVARAWSRPMLPPQATSTASKPYLGAIGAPPLRFQVPAPPPDLVTRPPAAAPPQPASTGEISDVTPHAAPPATTATITVNPTAVPANQPTDSAAAPEAEAPAPARTPPPILRDEIHRQTRAEDFLPFFQPPGANQNQGDFSMRPTSPTPGVQPPSSATYQQQ